MNGNHKRLAIWIMADIGMVWLSVIISYWFRFDGPVLRDYVEQALLLAVISSVVCTATMYVFRLYNRVWEYASIGEMVSVLKAVPVGSLVSFAAIYTLDGTGVPVSIMLRYMETLLLLLGGIRFAWRVYRDAYGKGNPKQRKALIVGAGDCGTMIAREMKFNASFNLYPVAFVDDDTSKQGLQVLGIPVLGGRESIPEIAGKFGIDEIIIAMPSAGKTAISEIIGYCKKTKAQLKIIPRMEEWIQRKTAIKEMRNVEVEDLLGRDPVKVDLEGIANYVEDKTVLVTGAGGSIGSELCRQLAPFRPQKLLMLGHGERSMRGIESEMRRRFPELRIETIIADVQDKEAIENVFDKHTPEVVFHAAAHKHVPLMERNPGEAVKNNVFGTKHVAEAADRHGAERFVLISTDKAVNPTSVMGTTKRIAEMFVQSLDKDSRTIFAVVRFGNVLGSRGSVIPRFKEQIARGGPVTVTHPEMIRYFMTIPEAVQLVIQAGAFARGGEIFILDMGKPVKILTLAEDLIRLSGLEPYRDVAIEFTGIRPGEKLYEELLTAEEGLASTRHDRIFIGKPVHFQRDKLEQEIGMLAKAVRENRTDIRQLLKHIVPTYRNVS